MPGPTLELLYDDQGPLWQVTYGGMTRLHRQNWQAWCYYEWAQALYAVGATVSKNEDQPEQHP